MKWKRHPNTQTIEMGAPHVGGQRQPLMPSLSHSLSLSFSLSLAPPLSRSLPLSLSLSLARSLSLSLSSSLSLTPSLSLFPSVPPPHSSLPTPLPRDPSALTLARDGGGMHQGEVEDRPGGRGQPGAEAHLRRITDEGLLHGIPLPDGSLAPLSHQHADDLTVHVFFFFFRDKGFTRTSTRKDKPTVHVASLADAQVVMQGNIRLF
jgi:hypothetical protein